MKKLEYTFILIILLSVSIFANPVNWELDKAHSKVQFTISHMVISEVTGQFKNFDAKITSDGDDFSKGTIDFTIDVNSINTDNENRDKHLKSDDFFNAEKYPKITFKGKSLKKTGNNKYKLVGDLTIRDITKTVTLDVVNGGSVKDPMGRTVTAFKINGTINRFDFGLKWNKLIESGGAIAGKDVNIFCNLELRKADQSEVSKQ